MISKIKLYSTNEDEISTFLYKFYKNTIKLDNNLYWEQSYRNPVEMADFIAAFIDNPNLINHTNLWASIDKGIYINIKEDNYNNFIKYLFERYPY